MVLVSEAGGDFMEPEEAPLLSHPMLPLHAANAVVADGCLTNAAVAAAEASPCGIASPIVAQARLWRIDN
jgi:hypothetical protein